MKKFLLALLTLAEELHVVDYQGVGGPEPFLETSQVAFFNSQYELVYEILTA